MRKSYTYAGITVLIWSTLATVVKLALADIPPLEALAVSSGLAFVFLLVLNIFNGSLREMKGCGFKDFLMMAGLGFLGLFLYSALYYFAIDRLGSQEACILNYLWPIMIIVFACVILKEKLTALKLVAVGMSFSGIVVLTLGKGGAPSPDRIIGIAACIAAAVCYGLFSVLNKRHSMNQNVTMMWAWFTTSVCAFAASLIFEKMTPIVGVQWLGMTWLGVVVNAVAYLLWAIALKNADDSAKVANLAYLVPFLSIILSAVVLGEKLTINAVFALLLIVGGILLQSFGFSKGKRGKAMKKIESFEVVTLYENGMRFSSVYEIVPRGENAEVSKYEKRYSGEKDERVLVKRAEISADEALELLNDCGLLSWNGFCGAHPRGVRDGIAFRLEAKVNGGEMIHADGSQYFPKNYRTFRDGLYQILFKNE